MRCHRNSAPDCLFNSRTPVHRQLDWGRPAMRWDESKPMLYAAHHGNVHEWNKYGLDKLGCLSCFVSRCTCVGFMTIINFTFFVGSLYCPVHFQCIPHRLCISKMADVIQFWEMQMSTHRTGKYKHELWNGRDYFKYNRERKRLRSNNGCEHESLRTMQNCSV